MIGQRLTKRANVTRLSDTTQSGRPSVGTNRSASTADAPPASASVDVVMAVGVVSDECREKSPGSIALESAATEVDFDVGGSKESGGGTEPFQAHGTSVRGQCWHHRKASLPYAAE